MFDPYYETKVNNKWGRLPIGVVAGITQLISGMFDVVFTISDLASAMSTVNGSVWQENSIWPTIGKGIWVGAIVSIDLF